MFSIALHLHMISGTPAIHHEPWSFFQGFDQTTCSNYMPTLETSKSSPTLLIDGLFCPGSCNMQLATCHKYLILRNIKFVSEEFHMGSRHKSLCMFATTLLKKNKIYIYIYYDFIILPTVCIALKTWNSTVRLWFMARVNSEVNLKETLWILTINLRFLEKESIFLFCITHHSCHSHPLSVLFPAIFPSKTIVGGFNPIAKYARQNEIIFPK